MGWDDYTALPWLLLRLLTSRLLPPAPPTPPCSRNVSR